MKNSIISQPNKSRVKPQADSQFIQQRPTEDADDQIYGELHSRSRERPAAPRGVHPNDLLQVAAPGSHTKVVRPAVSNKKGYQLDIESSDEGPNIEVPQVDVYMGHNGGKDSRRQEQSYNDNLINDSQQTDSRYDGMHQNVDVDLGDDTLLDG